MFFETKEQANARFPDSAIEGERTSFGDDYIASYRAHRVASSTWSKENAYSSVLDPILKDIYEKTGKTVQNFGYARDERTPNTDPISMGTNTDPISSNYINFQEEGINTINNIYKAYPDIYKDQPLLTKDFLEFKAGQIARDAEEHAQDMTSRADSSWGGFLAMGAGEMLDIAKNPALTATMFYGSWNVTPLRFALREALLGGGVTLATRPQVKEWRDSVGLEYSYGQAAAEVGTAAVFSGIFGLSLKGVVGGFKAIRNSGVKIDKGLEAEIQKAELELEAAIQNPIKADNDPLHIDLEHQDRVNDAIMSLLDPDHVPMPELPANRALPYNTVDEIVVQTQPENHVWLAPKDLVVDPKQFQFKSGGDKFGVNNRLKGIKIWDQFKTGTVVVYEALNGTKYIVDGHQRLGLANRILSQNDGQKPKLSAYIYKEADGFTKEYVMVKAAMKNIAEGTGDTIDAAKVLKISPEEAANLPQADSFVRTVQALAELDDEAFKLVTNGVVVPNHAAIVGRLVTDKSKHIPILKLLKETEPKNEVEVEAIVRQAMNVEFTSKTNLSLFGEENVIESLFKERATVIDLAIKLLKDNKKTFANLGRNKLEIEKQGNKLAPELNKQREMISANAAQIIQTLANRKGIISDALSEAAKKVKEGGKPQTIAREFAGIVEREIQRGSISGDIPSTTGRNTSVKTEGTKLAASAKELSEHDVPNGPGAKKEADVLERVLEEELNPIRQNFRQNDEIPVGQRIDENGELVPDYASPDEILKEIKQERMMLKRLEGCVT